MITAVGSVRHREPPERGIHWQIGKAFSELSGIKDLEVILMIGAYFQSILGTIANYMKEHSLIN